MVRKGEFWMINEDKVIKCVFFKQVFQDKGKKGKERFLFSDFWMVQN